MAAIKRLYVQGRFDDYQEQQKVIYKTRKHGAIPAITRRQGPPATPIAPREGVGLDMRGSRTRGTKWEARVPSIRAPATPSRIDNRIPMARARLRPL